MATSPAGRGSSSMTYRLILFLGSTLTMTLTRSPHLDGCSAVRVFDLLGDEEPVLVAVLPVVRAGQGHGQEIHHVLARLGLEFDLGIF